MPWLFYFIQAFLFSGIIGFIIIDRKKGSGNQLMRRWGGLAIIFSFLVSVLSNPELTINREFLGVIAGSLLVLWFGLLDDKRQLSWKIQIFFQLFLTLLLIWFGFGIAHIKLVNDLVIDFTGAQFFLFGSDFFLFGAIAFVVWLVALINSINWLDGIDGLAGTVTMLTLLAIFFVSLRPEVNQPAIAIISLIAIGATAGFLFLNIFSSQLIAGTAGSYFFGMIIAVLAVVAGTKIATVMLVVILPLTDAARVVIERFKEGRSIFKKDPHERHLHYKLKKLGWSDLKIVFLYAVFFSAVLFVDFSLESRPEKILLLTLEFAVIVFFMYYVSQKTKKIHQ